MEKISHFIHDIIDKDLAAGRVSEIHTRFPPEPNGYLHIGSAKAIWINWNAAKTYGGKFNLRYDDTNPVKEDDEYVQAIEQDLRWLGAIPDGGIFYGSDYFDKCYELAQDLIKAGKAFVCDLNPEQMTEYRGTLTTAGKESPFKNRTVEENIDLFTRMKAGEFQNGTHTLRAKIDMSSPNMNMRDPVIYRILHAHHHRQGDKWCIYPMYDFAHTIQDAIEGITHSCCSIEFENHRPLYDWVAENISIPHKPHQYEFARMNVTYTVMSKRYLRKLVETNTVEGWDDPRMPTLCGLRRKGYTPTAILDFVARSGVSKAQSMADIRLLEYCVCEELNKNATRKVAILAPIKVTIDNLDKTYYFDLPNNQNNLDAGVRSMPVTKEIFIEHSDFMEEAVKGFHRLVPNGEVRLMGAFLMRCTSVEKDEQGNILNLHCTVDLETANKMPADGRKVKGTIHWLSAEHCFDAQIRLFHNLFNQENVATVLEEENFESFINKQSMTVLQNCKLEPSLQNAKAGENFQFVRQGYFCLDSVHDGVFNRTCELKSGWKG